MSKKEEKIVEAEFEEVVQEETKEGMKPIHCGISVVMTEDGDISVHVHGSNQNLVVIDGLLKYAERYMDNTWSSRINGKE